LRPPPLTPRGSVSPRLTPRGSVAQELPKVSDSSGTGDTSGFQELPKVGVVDVAPVAPVALVGESRAQRKKHRDRLRASAKKNELPYPVCYNPHGYLEVPDICNRIATDWGKDPAGCMCAMQWPQFLAAAYSSGQAKRVQSAVCYDGELTLPAFLHEDVHQVDPEEEEAEEEGEPEEDEEEEAEEDAEEEDLELFKKKLYRTSLVGTKEFAKKIKEIIKKEAEDDKKVELVSDKRVVSRWISVSAVLILLFLGINSFLLKSNQDLKHAIKEASSIKEGQFKERLITAKKGLKRDLEEKHRADQVSYRAMARRLELEQQKQKKAEEL